MTPTTALSARLAILPLLCCIAAVLLNGPFRSEASKVEREKSVSAATAQKTAFGLKFGASRMADAVYRGEPKFAQAFQSGSARSLSVAAADFNRDGAPDLVTGYAGSEAFVSVQVGNIEAFAPSSPAIYQAIQLGQIPESFLREVQNFAMNETPDLLIAGDFDLDGMDDVLAGARGGSVYLFSGHGDGSFAGARALSLPGGVTALAKGKFNLGGSVSDVAVSVNGPQGPTVVVFDDEAGGVWGTPSTYVPTCCGKRLQSARGVYVCQ